MNEQLEELIEKYTYRLKSITEEFNPSYNCCDMAVANTEEMALTEFVKDLTELRSF